MVDALLDTAFDSDDATRSLTHWLVGARNDLPPPLAHLLRALVPSPGHSSFTTAEMNETRSIVIQHLLATLDRQRNAVEQRRRSSLRRTSSRIMRFSSVQDGADADTSNIVHSIRQSSVSKVADAAPNWRGAPRAVGVGRGVFDLQLNLHFSFVR